MCAAAAGPKECFSYTMASIATTDRLIAEKPDAAAAAVRAIVNTQKALKADYTAPPKSDANCFRRPKPNSSRELIRRDLPEL